MGSKSRIVGMSEMNIILQLSEVFWRREGQKAFLVLCDRAMYNRLILCSLV